MNKADLLVFVKELMDDSARVMDEYKRLGNVDLMTYYEGRKGAYRNALMAIELLEDDYSGK